VYFLDGSKGCPNEPRPTCDGNLKEDIESRTSLSMEDYNAENGAPTGWGLPFRSLVKHSLCNQAVPGSKPRVDKQLSKHVYVTGIPTCSSTRLVCPRF
jgi:hypothetical protein